MTSPNTSPADVAVHPFLDALEALLVAGRDDDSFARVLLALTDAFQGANAVLLMEVPGCKGQLHCIAARDAERVDALWRGGAMAERVLSGEVLATADGSHWSIEGPAGQHGLPSGQPVLHIPLTIHGQRGLFLVVREAGQAGFDPAGIRLARRIGRLASRALALREWSGSDAEQQRLRQLTEELQASQHALSFRARHDQLTALPNRSYMQELVEAAIAARHDGRQLALAFVDLDDFRRINEAHGNRIGDALLKAVARRLRRQLRSSDALGRISGDEFLILLDPVDMREHVDAAIGRISRELQRPFEIDGIEIRSSASIGVALFPLHGTDYDTLRQHADTAMQRAKHARKGGVAYFSRKLGEQAMQRLDLEKRLRNAITRRQFRCALQEKVNLRTGRVIGFEALVRWVDDAGTVHAPGTFLPVASELGLLGDMTELVLEDLLDHLSTLDSEVGPGITYSLNVSPAQAMQRGYMERLVRGIVSTGQTGRFIVELTEDALMTAGSLQSGILSTLKTAGIGVSIDDFGTGYSSLAALADLTADEIKVDRSLVTGIHQRPRSQVILRAIESLSSSLSMEMVAEGIETTEERHYLLKESSIRLGQGFLFRRPRLISDLLAELRAPAAAPADGAHASDASADGPAAED